MPQVKLPFTEYDLGRLQRGSTVVVTLIGGGANVRLMDSVNLRAFANGKSHKIRGGGLVKRSPHRMVVPSTGHWYVTVDVMGLRGSTRSHVSVEPPPLPTARSTSLMRAPLTDVSHGLPSSLTESEADTWDVFVSYASEDKAAVAQPLARALQDRGLSVWLDDLELVIGDSLRRKIDTGLARSAFGVVIFSKPFFAKDWPQYELDGIVSLSMSGKQRMLPVWHEITKDEVLERAPSMVDRIARSTSLYSVAEIADEIYSVVRPPNG